MVRTYIVDQDDVLSVIANKFYGDGTLWVKIAQANNIPLDEADYIAPGTVLVIPDSKRVSLGNVSTPTHARELEHYTSIILAGL